MAVTPDGTEVYVVNQDSNTVSVIATATHTVTDTVPVGNSLRAFGNFIGPLPASTPDVAISLLATPNPATVGQPFELEMDFTNSGGTFSGLIALNMIIGPTVERIAVSKGTISAGLSTTDFTIYSTFFLPQLPPAVGFLIIVMDTDTKAVVGLSVDTVGIDAALTPLATAALRRVGQEYISRIEREGLNGVMASPLAPLMVSFPCPSRQRWTHTANSPPHGAQSRSSGRVFGHSATTW